uniref:Uncharacterized protein n=1 Tax=Anopheles culicifacies TaxID=139723 RepID=A0A182MQM1_9DIPT
MISSRAQSTGRSDFVMIPVLYRLRVVPGPSNPVFLWSSRLAIIGIITIISAVASVTGCTGFPPSHTLETTTLNDCSNTATMMSHEDGHSVLLTRPKVSDETI